MFLSSLYISPRAVVLVVVAAAMILPLTSLTVKWLQIVDVCEDWLSYWTIHCIYVAAHKFRTGARMCVSRISVCLTLTDSLRCASPLPVASICGQLHQTTAHIRDLERKEEFKRTLYNSTLRQLRLVLKRHLRNPLIAACLRTHAKVHSASQALSYIRSYILAAAEVRVASSADRRSMIFGLMSTQIKSPSVQHGHRAILMRHLIGDEHKALLKFVRSTPKRVVTLRQLHAAVLSIASFHDALDILSGKGNTEVNIGIVDDPASMQYWNELKLASQVVEATGDDKVDDQMRRALEAGLKLHQVQHATRKEEEKLLQLVLKLVKVWKVRQGCRETELASAQASEPCGVGGKMECST